MDCERWGKSIGTEEAHANWEGAPMATDLQLSDHQKTALDKELASLKPRLEVRRAASDAPSFEGRQRTITGVAKHLQALRTFANSAKESDRSALEDICFVAGTFPEGFADRPSEADNFAFVWRWFEHRPLLLTRPAEAHAALPNIAVAAAARRSTLPSVLRGTTELRGGVAASPAQCHAPSARPRRTSRRSSRISAPCRFDAEAVGEKGD
jgi:hypothetical protein